ncbi:HNH endonuclease [uncultured Maricaulis sp.]|uniref:HNH endonuclease n=1 Tax=uncultured Maricaulis sp. TaxID=174710 RepID=UPI0030D783E4|tara:strand:+ start:3584 stop:4258 length:675 start_codon:yes stop_codon:yes gene_type:complete
MRKLQKGAPPGVLALNAERWKDELVNAKAAGYDPTPTQKSRYRNSAIKDALIAETLGKCAYCETKALHSQHGDIEHIIPKSKRPELSFDWLNLTLACRLCNGNKSDFYNGNVDEDVINPYETDPSECFVFFAERIVPLPNSPIGYVTIDKLSLDRPELVEDIRDRIDSLRGMMLAYESAASAAMKDIILNDIRERYLSDNCEYVTYMRKFFEVCWRGAKPAAVV